MLDCSSDASSSTPYDKAYILYRLHQEHDAREILGDVANASPDRGTQHLDAQLVSQSFVRMLREMSEFGNGQKFRQGEYHSAREVYNELLDTCPPVRHPLFPQDSTEL